MQSSSSSSLFIHIPTLTNTSTTTTTTTTPNNSNTSNTTTNIQHNLLSTNSTIDPSNELNQQLYNKLNSIQPTVIILSSNNLSSTVTNSSTATSHNTTTQLDLTKLIPLTATASANPSTQIKQVVIGNNANSSNLSANQRRKERPIQPKRVVTIAPNLFVASNQNVKQAQPQITSQTSENVLSTLINTQKLVENTPNQNCASRKSPQKRKISSTSQTKSAKKQLKDKSVDLNNNNNAILNESNSLNGSVETQRKRRQKRTKTQEKEDLKNDQVSENECVLKSNLNSQKNIKQRVKNKKQLEKNPATGVKATRRTRTLSSTKSTSLTQFSQTIFGKTSHKDVFVVDLKYEPNDFYFSLSLQFLTF